jgi:hypothetical protein
VLPGGFFDGFVVRTVFTTGPALLALGLGACKLYLRGVRIRKKLGGPFQARIPQEKAHQRGKCLGEDDEQ